MFAQAVPDLVSVIETWSDGDMRAIVISCGESYEEYNALPEALMFDGSVFGKTGWNSDVHKAYYTNKAKLARVV